MQLKHKIAELPICNSNILITSQFQCTAGSRYIRPIKPLNFDILIRFTFILSQISMEEFRLGLIDANIYIRFT